VAIDAKDQIWRFNFALKSGEETKESVDFVMKRVKFDPDAVKKVILSWWVTNARLDGIQLFDHSGNNILK
jgi:hypothetical protein